MEDKIFSYFDFLAPTGVLGVAMSICLYAQHKFVFSTQSSPF